MKPKTFPQLVEEYFRIFILAGEIELAKKIFRRHKARAPRDGSLYESHQWLLHSSWFEDLLENLLHPIPPKKSAPVYVPYGDGECNGSPCNDA
ncbi:MAG: hypothetical protein AAB447_00065 [Patescibacteria group bacterium]